ncbi:NitT/TauT family transport system ATP-binding protein [Kineothrix alysoides]|uniref:NitT/TauT family transport system ATP-binding protein n=1 Tax=Kineothrix alysoides TaxID=1469948 RepID=A0A4V2QBR0_9FIRM|nr:ATP-binding cassette domain-containing protein [Kineothrix alysoides]TCL57292.1 NitT/TauT family transport system ATP-binding protein [Kineothrix alysoides]
MDIDIINLSKKYGEKEVLRNFSIRISEGAVTSVMAPSGAGKTTLLKILAGLEKADEGSVTGMEGSRIGMVFQEDRLCENLNAIANIRLVCDSRVTVPQIEKELRRVGLEGSERQPVRELSGGMRRRTALVRALLSPYDILILDEPFKGLDEHKKNEVMSYTLKKSMGKTVILVTHDEKEAKFMGGKIIYMNDNNYRTN